MGTKMQYESYLPGYSSMRDLNKDPQSSWSAYYEDMELEKHLYNNFMSGPFNEYSGSGYDKEMLKRTMLEHEAIFRKQVCELHRLYRTQKDLMGNLRSQEFYKLLVQRGMQQSDLFSSAVTSEITENNWQIPHLTYTRTGFNMTTVADSEDIKPSLDLFKEIPMQFSQSPKTGAFLKDEELSGNKVKSLPTKMFNFQLPADIYIDVEDSDRIEKEQTVEPFCNVRDNFSTISNIEDENDVKLTLGNGDDFSRAGWYSDSIRKNGQSIQSFNFLNESKRGLSCEGESDSVFSHFLYGNTVCEFGDHQLRAKSNRTCPSRDVFTDKHRDRRVCSKLFDEDKKKTGPGYVIYKDIGTGGEKVNSFTLGLSNSDKCPLLSESSELKVNRENNFSPSNHSQMCFKEKSTLGAVPNQKGSLYAASKNSAVTDSQVPGQFSFIPLSDDMNYASAKVRAKKKPQRDITHIPIAIQALPCLPPSEMMNSRKRKHKESIQTSTTVCHNLHQGGEIELPPSKSGFRHDLWSDSSYSPQFKHSSASTVHENSEACAAQKIPKLKTSRKLEESSGVSWLKIKPRANSSVELSFLKSHNQSPENFPSSLQVKEKRKQKNRTSQSVGTENGIKKNGIYLNTTSAEDEVLNSIEKTVHEIELEIPIPPYETLETLAAENLLVMSLGLTQQLAPVKCDPLHWFAKVVSSTEANAGDDDDEDKMVDLFESSILNLEEMKPEEYLPIPHAQDNRNLPHAQDNRNDENDLGIVSLILSKARRGQLRKRRQKKDFQKDILPGLVTLSRHEMTEDLQAFDCLMRAMGEAWECNLTRQSIGRKWSRVEGRGRRRPQILEVINNEKVEIGEKSLIAWGRTTRRGRRPRGKLGNASLLS